MEWATGKRTGKIFIDHNMNVRGKTCGSSIRPAGRRAPRLDALTGKGWKRPIRRTSPLIMCRALGKRATGGKMHSSQNRALQTLSAVMVDIIGTLMAAPRSIGSLTVSFGWSQFR